MILRICVYSSSSSVVAEAYVRATQELGRLIVERGHSLVYGGARIGLMGELAGAVKAAGGHVLGVIPRRLLEYGLAYEAADEMVVVETMAERKALMEQRADAFVALPGGFGTLDELSQVLTLKQLEMARGPVALLNTAGFYSHLLAHWEQLYQQGFAKPGYRQLYYVAEKPVEVIDYLEGYQDSSLPRKWF
jgi:cytokinin riboside 5'-monophosphate phosphoribohydrolase